MKPPEWDGEYLWVTMGQYAAMGQLGRLCLMTTEPDAPDHMLWVAGLAEIFGENLALELIKLSRSRWPDDPIPVRVRELYPKLYYRRVMQGGA